MKILFVAYLYYPDITGGAARSVQFLAESLVEQGHEVSIVRFHPQGAKAPEVINGVTVHYLTLRNIYWPFDGQKRPGWKRKLWHLIDLCNPLAMWDFSRILRQVRPDVVNTSIISGFSTGIFYVCRWHGVKLIHTMRDYYLMCAQVGMFKSGCNCDEICNSCKPFALVRSHALQNADMVLGNSQFVVDRHRKHQILPVGVPAYAQVNMNLSPIRSSPRELQPALGSPPVIRFGYLGKLSDTKGVEPLLQAVSKLQENNWTLTIAGKGDASYVEYLKRTYTNSKITFLGWAESSTVYESIDVLLCPSVYHDPLPRVVLEAYSQGLPVIVSDTGGLPEMVEPGLTGFVVDPTDIEALAACMQNFCTAKVDYAAMSHAALQKAGSYTKEAVVTQYLQRLREVTA